MSEAKEMNELLSSLNACKEAILWAKNKSWKDHRSKSGSYKMQFVGISKERKEV